MNQYDLKGIFEETHKEDFVEETPLGTGGALAYVAKMFHEDTLFVLGDLMLEVEVEGLLVIVVVHIAGMWLKADANLHIVFVFLQYPSTKMR